MRTEFSREQLEQLLAALGNRDLAPQARAEFEDAREDVASEAVASADSEGIRSGRDTNITTNWNVALSSAEAETQKLRYFVELDTDEVASTKFAPHRLRRIIDLTRDQRLIVLKLEPDVPGPALLQDVAISLRQELSDEQPDLGIETILKYTIGSSKDTEREKLPLDLATELTSLQEPVILMLSSVSRQQLGWDLDVLRHAAELGGHYIIASTEIVQVGWGLVERERKYWHEVTSTDLYNVTYLEDVLVQTLSAFQQRLPGGIQLIITSDNAFIGDMSVPEAARRLRTEINVIAFVHVLCAQEAAVEVGDLSALIDEVAQQDVGKTIRRWFEQSLTRSEQLIAIGLSLFDGMQESQVFSALQELLSHIWLQGMSTTSILDHIDLENLLGFFAFPEVRSYQTGVEGKLPGQRLSLLRVAYEKYRRHLLLALPWLADVVKDSVEPHASKSELYATPVQRSQLRASIGEALSDVGCISIDLVQPALLSLVAHKRPDMHVAVARIVAPWYALGEADRILLLLRRWQKERRSVEIVRSLLKQTYPDIKEPPESFIASAIVLIVSYTARYIRPGDLPPELLNVLIDLTPNLSPRTLQRFRDYLIPMLIPLHLRQLKDVLAKLTYHAELRQTLSQGLAGVYEKEPMLVREIIGAWYQQGMTECRPYVPDADRTLSETLLTTVVLTLSELPYDTSASKISLETASKLEARIYEKTCSPLVRTAVWTACVRQLRHDNATLQRILAEAAEDEYPQIVKLLTEAFIEQRAALDEDGGDSELVTIKGRSYRVWLYNDAPKTAIEQTMEYWIAKSEHGTARTIALLTSISIAQNFYLEERVRVADCIRVRMTKSATSEQPAESHNSQLAGSQPVTKATNSWRDYYVHAFVPVLATLDTPHCRKVISELLPAALKLSQSDQQAFSFVLEKWKVSKYRDTIAIAYCLDEAVVLALQGWKGLYAAGLIRVVRAARVVFFGEKLSPGVSPNSPSSA